MTSITIPAQTIPAQSIPVTVTVKAATVPAQTVALPNSGVSVGTYGDATHVPQLTINAQGIVTGASSIPIAGGAPAVPDFTTALLAAVAAGEYLDWPYGDVTLAAPITVNLTANVNGIGFDMHGGHITMAASYTAPTPPVNMITFVGPTSNPSSGINVRALSVRNAVINGGGKMLNGLAFVCDLATTGIYASDIENVAVMACAGSGFYIQGNVFELQFTDCVGCDNTLDGLQINNPTAGNGVGIISSIWIEGGDWRTNGRFGIGLTATTAYQEAHGVKIEDCDFIANGSAGVGAGAGCTIKDCHFESNNSNSATWGSTQGAIFVWGGWVTLDTVDCANAGGTKYLVDLGSPGPSSSSAIKNCYIGNENGATGAKLARLFGAGTLSVDRILTAADYDSNGQWQIVEPVTTTRTV